jgi:hypothetical protein
MPTRLLRSIAQQQQAALAQLKAVARTPASKQAGCYAVLSSTNGRSSRSVGVPLAPAIHAHLIGHHLEIAFSFPRWPRSLSCRPAFLTVVVNGQHPQVITPNTSGPGSNGVSAITTYALPGPHGRVVSDLPLQEPPPYHLQVTASLLNNSQSPEVRSVLTCPNSTSTTHGCAPPARSAGQTAADEIQPSGPFHALRDLTKLQLQQSLIAVSADQPIQPRVACMSTTRCQLTYLDIAARGVKSTKQCSQSGICQISYQYSNAPAQPYTIEYKIAAEQDHSCWMAIRTTRSIDLPPFVYPGADDLAGCRHWPN